MSLSGTVSNTALLEDTSPVHVGYQCDMIKISSKESDTIEHLTGQFRIYINMSLSG